VPYDKDDRDFAKCRLPERTWCLAEGGWATFAVGVVTLPSMRGKSNQE
jgi:hypothetical protein